MSGKRDLDDTSPQKRDLIAAIGLVTQGSWAAMVAEHVFATLVRPTSPDMQRGYTVVLKGIFKIVYVRPWENALLNWTTGLAAIATIVSVILVFSNRSPGRKGR